mgnify:CR=1 FL=1
MDQEYSRLLEPGQSLSERIRTLHAELIERIPVVDHVSCVLYEPQSDMLRTYLSSTRRGTGLHGYEFPLSDSESLSRLAQEGFYRVIDDIPASVSDTSKHSRWLLEQGYRSSFTVPVFDVDRFAGFVFFDSMEPAAFTPERQRDALVYAGRLGMAMQQDGVLVRNILQSATVAREVVRLRDFETGAHVDRIAWYSRMIARGVADRFGFGDDFIEHLFRFAPLHDIGKVGIPDAILRKPAPLTPAEFEIMKTHVQLGMRLVGSVMGRLGVSSLADSQIILNLIHGHHERLDGSGYPRGVRDGDIPIEARIVAVSDVFDALVTDRPYKKAWPFDDAFDELDRMAAAGKLDPHCVAALGANRDEVRRVHRENPEL